MSTMRELETRSVDDFMPFAERLRAEGASDDEIKRAFRNQLDLKKSNFYRHKAKPIGGIKDFIEAMNLKKMADSAAERSFLDYLYEADIKFQFQKPIGKYRVDFLVEEFMVFELDGPHHKNQKSYDDARDRYMESLGYVVVRFPLWIVSTNPEAVIERLKELIESRRSIRK